MAREILFKAKRTDNGEWVEGSLITGVFCRLGQDIPYIFCPKEADYDCFEDFSEENGIFEAQPDTICQYTGLTDKNGKKIWENDILKANLDESYPEDITYIKILWNECGFCVNENYSTDIWTLEKWDAEHFQVCGNIFDNPDLLEVK